MPGGGGPPSYCLIAAPTSRLAFAGDMGRGWLRLAPPGPHDPGSILASMGPAAGHLYVSLARTWEPGGHWGRLSRLPAPIVPGEQLSLHPGGHVWVSDSVPGYGLVLRAQVRVSFEVCALAFMPRPATFTAKL